MKTKLIAFLLAVVAMCGCEKEEPFVGTTWVQGDTELTIRSESVVYFHTEGYWPREGTYTKEGDMIAFNLRTDTGAHIYPDKWSEETWERVAIGSEIVLISGTINGDTMVVKYTHALVSYDKEFNKTEKEFVLNKRIVYK